MENEIVPVDQVIKTLQPPEIFDHSFHWMGRPFKSTVRVNIFHHNGFNMVILQDINDGTSVTNACEQIATEVSKLKRLDPTRTIWLECYSKAGAIYDVDRIYFRYSARRAEYSDPTWGPVKNLEVIEFLQNNLKP